MDGERVVAKLVVAKQEKWLGAEEEMATRTRTRHEGSHASGEGAHPLSLNSFSQTEPLHEVGQLLSAFTASRPHPLWGGRLYLGKLTKSSVAALASARPRCV